MNFLTVSPTQNPSINILSLIISLGLTVLAYCAFPLIYANNCKKAIPKKKYTKLCYGINFLIMLVFALINGGSSGAPYLLWTWVFSKSGLKALERRGLLVEAHSDLSAVDPGEAPHSEDVAPPAHPLPDFPKMPADEAMTAIFQMQAKNIVDAMEANSKNQPDNEGDTDFGLVPEKPIFTSALESVKGERRYLDKLHTPNGERITYNRLGSTCANGINGMIDIYETFLPSGQPYKTIYINMYGAKQSTKAPAGFSLVQPAVRPTPTPVPQKGQPSVASIPQATKAVKAKYCSKCGSTIDNKTKKCTGCDKQYFQGFRINKFSITVIVLVLIIVALSTVCILQHWNNQKLDSTYQAAISEQESKISSLEQQVSSSDTAIKIRDNTIKNLERKIDTLEKKANQYDDIVNGMQLGNTGYAASNFFASDSVIVVSKNETNRKFKLTANWSNGGTVYVDYSSSAALVSFDNDEWSTSTQMSVHPLSEGVTIVTFSNSVNSKTFKVLIIVTA